MLMEKVLFGNVKDKPVYKYTIKNGSGMTAEVINYGAILRKLRVPYEDRTIDVVLGYESLDAYTTTTCYYGATVVPHANRIGGATYTLNGVTYELEKNDGNNSLHSGTKTLAKQVWEVTNYSENSITLAIEKPDMDLGFPGNLTVTVTYTLTDDNSLKIYYTGLSDKDTVFNPTNHTYFNLGGHKSGTILDHTLKLAADSFTWADSESIPHGEITPVKGTPMDFTTEKTVGQDIDADYDPLNWALGYDHNWIIRPDYNTENASEMIEFATLRSPKTGITMKMYTDLPGVQVYAGNYIVESEFGKGGIHYPKRGGICFETQFFPNAINVPSFPQPVIKAGEKFESTTIYKFE